MSVREPTGARYLGLALVGSALLCMPYLLAGRSFFYTDDWVYIQHYGLIPPWQVWRYFSPQVIWFYRPLQALQFGWLFHAAGLHPLAYNLLLLALHLGVCTLVFTLASHLTAPRTALLATALFASQCLCSDVLLWRSNISTLDWALATLGMCVMFLRCLERPSPARWGGVYALFLLGFLAKEAAVGSPLLLGLLWTWQSGQEAAPVPPTPRLKEGAKLMWPFVLISILYASLHGRLFRDVYDGYVGPFYTFVPPAQALQQTLISLNMVLTSFSRDPLFLPFLPGVQSATQYLVGSFLVLPVLIGAAAWQRRDRVLAFGLVWIVVTLLPTAGLTTFRMDRFFYVPAIGGALLMARAAQQCWLWASRSGARGKAVRLTLTLAMAYLNIANLSAVTLQCMSHRDDSRLLRAAFLSLQQNAHRLPRGSLVVLRNAPEPYFGAGLGILEMVRLGLKDPTAVGIIQGQRLSPRWARRLDAIQSVYVLDLSQQPLSVRAEPVRAAQRKAVVTHGRHDGGSCRTGSPIVLCTRRDR